MKFCSFNELLAVSISALFLSFSSVKCLQKTVKDSYYIICKPCALQLELCAKCGKKEEIVIP